MVNHFCKAWYGVAALLQLKGILVNVHLMDIMVQLKFNRNILSIVRMFSLFNYIYSEAVPISVIFLQTSPASVIGNENELANLYGCD